MNPSNLDKLYGYYDPVKPTSLVLVIGGFLSSFLDGNSSVMKILKRELYNDGFASV